LEDFKPDEIFLLPIANMLYDKLRAGSKDFQNIKMAHRNINVFIKHFCSNYNIKKDNVYKLNDKTNEDLKITMETIRRRLLAIE